MSRTGHSRMLLRRGYDGRVSATAPLVEVEVPFARESPALRAMRDANVELTRTRATPAAAFLAARRMYLHGRRVDMNAIASELGISRATLYRWTGSRERLLADVLWHLSDRVFEQAKAEHSEHTGVERLLAIFRQHVGVLVEAEPLHIFLKQETHTALRILTSAEGRGQPGP